MMTKVQVLAVLLAVNEATEYFVSVDGDDNHPGTLEKPWRHVATKGCQQFDSWRHMHYQRWNLL